MHKHSSCHILLFDSCHTQSHPPCRPTSRSPFLPHACTRTPSAGLCTCNAKHGTTQVGEGPRLYFGVSVLPSRQKAASMRLYVALSCFIIHIPCHTQELHMHTHTPKQDGRLYSLKTPNFRKPFIQRPGNKYGLVTSSRSGAGTISFLSEVAAFSAYLVSRVLREVRLHCSQDCVSCAHCAAL